MQALSLRKAQEMNSTPGRLSTSAYTVPASTGGSGKANETAEPFRLAMKVWARWRFPEDGASMRSSGAGHVAAARVFGVLLRLFYFRWPLRHLRLPCFLAVVSSAEKVIG